jgi:hypothetical protein
LQFPRKDNAGAEETMKAAMIFLAGAALVCAPAPARAADYPSKIVMRVFSSTMPMALTLAPGRV